MNIATLLTPKPNLQRWAPLLIRLVIGYGFMNHGWAKVSNGSPDNFEKLITQVGAPFPHLTAWLVPCIEMLGGLAIFFGAFVSLAAIPLIGVMLVAIFTVYIKYGFSSIKTIGLTPDGPVFGPPGYEVALLYIAGLMALILGGAGVFSVDSMIANRLAARSEAGAAAK